MSFVFPKPAYTDKPRNSSSDPDFDLDDNYYKLLQNQEPDYDELLMRLSLFAFSRLFPGDQQKHVAKISRKVNVEDVQFLEESDEASRLATFAELFKKLPFPDQLEVFLSKVIHKLNRETQRMTSSDDDDDEENGCDWKSCFGELFSSIWLQDQSTTGEQLSNADTDVVASNDLTSAFGEFFLGFSVIWFQGQSTSGQDMLIEQLEKGTKGVVVIENRRREESEKDFRLRRFTDLCMNVVDFMVQEKFLEIAEWKLREWQYNCDSRLIGEPLDFGSAAELQSRLWTFGVSQLSAKYQEQKIDQMSSQVEPGVETTERPFGDDHHHEEEGIRIRILRKLFNQVRVPTRINLLEELMKTLLVQKRYSDSVRVFRRLGSKSQEEIIEYLLYGITTGSVEKFCDESEEDFRLRRFNQICVKQISTWGDTIWPKAYSLQLHAASDPYDEFMSGLSGLAIIWFKAKCANIRRNPVQLILFSHVEIDDTIEKKLQGESEEEYRLRRFKESFEQLELTAQKRVLDYIQDTLSKDLGYPEPTVYPLLLDIPSVFQRRGLIDPDWISYN